jgi:hypothetical protein
MSIGRSSERNLRNAIAIDDRNAVLHDNLGRLWTNVAHDRESHGDDPRTPSNARCPSSTPR